MIIAPAPGWTHVPIRDNPGIVVVTSADAAGQRPFVVFTSLGRLSRKGIVVWATDEGRGGPNRTFTPGRWPLRLSSFRVDHGWEGQPAARIQQRLRWVAVRGRHLDVRVYFGTEHPSRALVAKAQAELDRIALP